MTQWFRRKHAPEENPQVKEAMDARNSILIEADKAIRKVDQVQAEVIADYVEAEKQRLRRKKR